MIEKDDDTTSMNSMHPRSNITSLNSTSRELRDYVWELALTNSEEKTEIDLLTATSPNASLLCTCRQVSAEASKHYEAAQDLYWATNKFVIEAEGGDCKRPAFALHRLDDNHVRRITSVSIRGLRETYSYLDGLWMCSGPCHVTSIPNNLGGYRCPDRAFIVPTLSTLPRHVFSSAVKEFRRTNH